MEFLQIWIGDKPRQELIDCIDSVRSHVDSKDKYTMISSINFLKDSSVNWIPYEECVTEMRKEESIDKFFDYVNSLGVYSTINTNKSDLIRFYYASQHKNVLYADVDIRLKSLPEFEDDLYFVPFVGRVLDFFMFFNGSNTDIPKMIIEKSIFKLFGYRGINPHKEYLFDKTWCFLTTNRLMNKTKQRKRIIDSIHFEHLNDSRK